MLDEAASNIVASKSARMDILHWHRCGYLFWRAPKERNDTKVLPRGLQSVVNFDHFEIK